MDSTPVIEPPLDYPLPIDIPPTNTDASASTSNPANPPLPAANNPPPQANPQDRRAEARRRRRNRKLIPRFGRSHPLLYRLLLLAAQFQTPLTILTILSTSGYLRRKTSSISPLSSSGTPQSTRSNSSLSKLGFTSPFGLNLALFLPLKFGLGEGSGLGMKGRTTTVALWWMMMASFWSRHVLVGTSVWWVLNGWEDEGEGEEGGLR
jgi:hypothetical protein